jgi:hypothetical protein
VLVAAQQKIEKRVPAKKEFELSEDAGRADNASSSLLLEWSQ